MTAPTDPASRRAVEAAHRWFEATSGWSPPDVPTLAEWLADGVCRAPDDCMVVPRGACRHGLASWLLVLEAERAAAGRHWDPSRMLPRPDRLDLTRPGAPAVVEAHEAAVEAGEAGYPDPLTGLFVLTARYLWDRGGCCGSGCRHCPY